MSYPYIFENYRYDVLNRLKNRVEKKENGCHEWLGSRTKQGYGQMILTVERGKSRTSLCHRVLWEFENDVELGKGIYVQHKCGNRSCLNIEHLYVKKDKGTTS